jgi:hypothetical protein
MRESRKPFTTARDASGDEGFGGLGGFTLQVAVTVTAYGDDPAVIAKY